MDIVKFWNDVTESFNDTAKCDFCWYFGAPLDNAAANVQQSPVEACDCVHVMVTDTAQNSIKGYSARTGLLNSHVDDYTFTLLVVKKDDIGTNTYNEILDHPIAEGKWERILRPLQKCLEGNAELERLFCDILGEQLRVTNWRMKVKKNYADNNYTGWEIMGTFRQQII